MLRSARHDRRLLKTGVILTGIGVYSFNTKDDEASKIRNVIREKVMAHDWALQLHGFYVDPQTKELRFDVVLSFEADEKEALKTLYTEMEDLYPDYQVMIAPDIDV